MKSEARMRFEAQRLKHRAEKAKEQTRVFPAPIHLMAIRARQGGFVCKTCGADLKTVAGGWRMEPDGDTLALYCRPCGLTQRQKCRADRRAQNQNK